MERPVKVLQLAAADVTAKLLLLPLVKALEKNGYQVHVACSEGPHARALAAQGHMVHFIPIERRISPLSNMRSLLHLYRLIRQERFDVVHVHTPVAAVLGRVAAYLAGVPVIMYTAHGFYFHDRMAEYKRRPLIWLERMLGRITNVLFTQSKEDAVTAARERICPMERVVWIGNGVDLGKFQVSGREETREKLGIGEDERVVGFVGRMVREKGVVELMEAAEAAGRIVPGLRLLLVGDTLDSDRDHKTKAELKRIMDRDGLASRVTFTGFIEDVASVMPAMDVLALPSYREGMPRTIIEAMACGKPVVATAIRGCREEVVHGVTGLLVPPKDATALGQAIIHLLSNPTTAARMGAEGRKRAMELFDERQVLERQIQVYDRLVMRDRARRVWEN